MADGYGRLPRCQRDVNQRPQPTATRGPESGGNQRDLRLAETRRNHLRRNGKEGVNGSSPLEGFTKYPQTEALSFGSGEVAEFSAIPAGALRRELSVARQALEKSAVFGIFLGGVPITIAISCGS